MDILTGITPLTQKLTAVAANDAAAPNDPFSAVLANSMSEAKIAMASDTDSDKPVLETPAESETAATPDTDSSGQNMLAMLAQINAYQAASADKDSPVTPSGQSRPDSRHANSIIAVTTDADSDKPVLAAPAEPETAATPATDISGQNPLTTHKQINAYQAAIADKDSADKDSPVTTGRQSRSDSRHANPAIAMTVATATSPIGATTELAKPAPLHRTEPSNQALALDKLTAGHGKTETADTLDTATAASVANAPLLTLTPTHLAAVLMPLMDAPQTTVAQASVNTLFGKSGWAQAVGQQVMVMVKEEVQTLNLTLNPPNLGPLQVVVKIENQVANVQFSSATLEVQQALRNGLPILQEMFGQAGVALGQTDIGYRQPQRDPRNKPEKHSESSIKPEEVLIQSIHNAQKDPSNRQGLVNLYA